MSKLLDDLIKQSRADAAAYEEFLQKAEALVKRLAQKQPDDGVPAVLHGKPEAIVLFNNLASISGDDLPVPCATMTEGRSLRSKSTWRCARGRRRAGRATTRARSTGAERAFPDHDAGPRGDAGDLRDHQEPTGLLMTETIQLGEHCRFAVTRKDIKHVHLSVHPPSGRVTLVAPTATRLEVARAYAISKLGWIREQQAEAAEPGAGSPRQFVERESHYLWGRRYLLTVRHRDAKPSVALDHRRITLTVRPGASAAKRAEVMNTWHKSLLHGVLPELIQKWERKLSVVAGLFPATDENQVGKLQSSEAAHPPQHRTREEAKDLLEYVIVHEMVHLIEPTHSDRFIALLNKHYPLGAKPAPN